MLCSQEGYILSGNTGAVALGISSRLLTTGRTSDIQFDWEPLH